MTEMNDLRELLRQFEAGVLETDASKLGDLEGHDIMLYGAGNIGKRLYHSLQANGLQVAGFLDRNPEIAFPSIPVPIYLPEDPALIPRRKSCTVILSGLFSLSVCGDIKAALAGLGFRNVHALNEVNFSQVNNGSFRESLFSNSYDKIDLLGKDRSKLEHAFSLFHTETERAFFLKYLKAHLTMDFVRLDAPHDIGLQYLAHDIPTIKDYSRLVDCGGYDGDTFRQLVSHGYDIEDLVAFEPQIDLFTKYAAAVRTSQRPPKRVFLFPCGVYSDTTQLRFAICDDAKSSGRVSATGGEVIQCVKLDDALQGFSPTFIKMDIEGAETAALQGATEIIRAYGPQLAICVYHTLSDLWEVPNIISNIREDYRYYLRSYNYMGLETVLYAIPTASHA
jgi:FkbM family methyltransferase